jgi:hypothetical protein
MHPISATVLLGICLGGLSACSSALLMTAPVSKSGDGWGITLGQIKEGPDEYVGEGGVMVNAETDGKLMWTVVTVKNESAEEQTFSYDTCVLDGKDLVRQALVVDRYAQANAEVNAAADRSEAIEPGQSRTRQLIYSFPKEQRPTRMRCGSIALPVKARR